MIKKIYFLPFIVVILAYIFGKLDSEDFAIMNASY